MAAIQVSLSSSVAFPSPKQYKTFSTIDETSANAPTPINQSKTTITLHHYHLISSSSMFDYTMNSHYHYIE